MRDLAITLEIEANIAMRAPDGAVRTVTENCRTLGLSSRAFERE